MTPKDVQDTVRAGTLAAVRKALKAYELQEGDVDTLFALACQNGKASVIKHIQSLGSPSSAAYAQGVLTLTTNAKDKPALELLEHVDDEDLDATDSSGRSTLAHAARLGRQKVLEALIARGADIDHVDNDGNPPLHWAFEGKKAKAAKSLFAAGITLSSPQAAKLVHSAPNKPLRDLVVAAFLDNRVSAMSREAFVARWGAIEDLPSPVSMCVDPLGETVMKGRFTTAGYFSHASGKDPHSDDLDWEAIDHAKTIAEALITALGGTSYVPGSEGDSRYAPFFIPALGRTPKTQDLDANVSDEAKSAAHGAYANYIQSSSTGSVLFEGDYFSANEDFIEADTRALFMSANAVAKEHLNSCKKYMVYTDFVTFPVIFGGLDKYYNFVGVISHGVWT